MNVMLLTAGLGTRLRPYTLQTPKPLIPFLGVPMVEYTLSLLENTPVSTIVCNVHHLPEKVRSYFGLYKPKCKDFYISDESQRILDTGGGIREAGRFLKGKGDFFAFNGDEVVIPTRVGVLKELMSLHQHQKNIATLLVTPHEEVGKKFGGVYVDSNNRVVQFSKQPVEGLRGLHYTGVILFSNRIFDYFKKTNEPENILYDTITHAISNGESVGVLNEPLVWFETGNSNDFIKATRYCLDQLESSPDPWVEILRQTINYAYPHKAIIELQEDPQQWQRLQNLFTEKFSHF